MPKRYVARSCLIGVADKLSALVHRHRRTLLEARFAELAGESNGSQAGDGNEMNPPVDLLTANDKYILIGNQMKDGRHEVVSNKSLQSIRRETFSSAVRSFCFQTACMRPLMIWTFPILLLCSIELKMAIIL